MAQMEEKNDEDQLMISTLPASNGWGYPLLLFHGFWYPQRLVPGCIAFRNRFKSRDTDILLASFPKSGTTWLKALAFTTLNRKHHDPLSPRHPLLGSNPHGLVPFVDINTCKLESLPSPRLLNVHMPYSLLPETVRVSNSKIVYICRDPKDALISHWCFYKQIDGGRGDFSLEEACGLYCDGVAHFGPVWEHQVEYWKESLRRPEKVLFLKYEDVVEDPVGSLRKLAEFVGDPFSSEEEEKGGVVEGIARLCSFDKLSGLEVNRNGGTGSGKVTIRNSLFFRKGGVGDWKNYLSPEMVRRLDEISEEKLSPYGLRF